MGNTTGNVSVGSGVTGTVNAVLSNAANGVSLTGGGTLVLANTANTFTGNVTVGAGTLSFAAPGSLGAAANNIVLGTSAAAATLDYSGSTATLARGIALGTTASSNYGINVGTSGQTLTVTGNVTGGVATGTLTVTGAGVLAINNATATNNTFLSNIVVDGGGLQVVGSNGTAGDPLQLGQAAKTITLQNGGRYIVVTTASNPTNTLTKGLVIGSGGGTINTNGVQLTLDDASQFSGTGVLTKTGSSVLLLGNDYSAYTGGSILVNAGTLQLQNNASAAGNATKAVITLATGTALNLKNNANLSFNNPIVVSGTGSTATIDVNNSSAGTANTLTMGTLGIGASTLNVTGGNTYTLATGAVTLTSTATGNTTFNPTTGLVSLASVTGSATAGNVDTLALGGTAVTSPGNFVTGAIANGAGGGTVALSKSGASVWTLTGTNTYTGGTAVTAGVLTFGKTASAPTSGTIPVSAGAVLGIRVGGTGEFVNDPSAATANSVGQVLAGTLNGSTVTYAAGSGIGIDTTSGSQTYTGDIGASGTGRIFAKLGTNTLTLSGNQTYTGLTTVYNGTLALSGTNAGVGATINSGATLQVGSQANLGATTGTLTLNGGTFNVRSDTALSFANPVSFANSSTVNVDRAVGGAGTGNTITLGTFSQPSVAARTLTVTGANGYGLAIGTFPLNSGSGNTTTVVANAKVAITTVTNPMSGFVAGNFDTLTLDGTATGNTVTNAIANATGGTLTAGGYTRILKQGTGTWALNGTNTYTGPTFVDNGTLTFGATANQTLGVMQFGSAAAITTTGTLNTSGNVTFGGTALVQSNSATANVLTVASGKTVTLTSGLTMGEDVATATGATATKLTVTGTGGAFAITGGSVQLGVSQTVVNSANTSIATLDLTGLTGANGFSATGLTNFNVGQGNNVGGTVLLTNTANAITATTLNVGTSNGNNEGGDSFLTLGTGTNALKADAVNIGVSKATGTLKFVSQTLGTSGTVTIANKAGTGAAAFDVGDNTGTATAAIATGTLDLRGHLATVAASTLSIGVGSNTAAGGATGTVSFDTGTFTVAGALVIGSKSGTAGTGAGTGTLNVGGATPGTGTGTFTVNSTGSFTLATNTAATGTAVASVNVTGGSLVSNVAITKGGGTGTSATITLNGGTLNLTNHAIGTAAQTITTTLQSGTLQNVSEINGGGAVAKTGSGSLIYAGTLAYTGTTTVSAGTLAVNGSLTATPSVTVASTATLGGSGTISAPVTIQAGATLAPGNSAGVLTVKGLSLANNTSTYAVEITGADNTVPASAQYDQTVVSGTTAATLGGAALTVSDGGYQSGQFAPPAAGDKFWIVDGAPGSATVSGNFSFGGSPLADGATFTTASGVSYQINYNQANDPLGSNSDVVLTATAVPEPASAGLLALAGVGLLARRRRKA